MKLTATKKGIRIIPKAKRESFLPSDKRWLESHNDVQLGKFLGEGCYGKVYSVRDNPRLIVKIDHSESDNYIKDEINEYNRYSMGRQPLLTPSRVVNVKTSYGNRIGVVKPKVQVCNEQHCGKQCLLTDNEIEDIRQKVIQLSQQGYILQDRIQVGRAADGRILQFDTGMIERIQGTKNKYYLDHIYTENEKAWEQFLRKQGKWEHNEDSDIEKKIRLAALQKYGRITR